LSQFDFELYEYFGGMQEGTVFEDLCRTPDGGWLLVKRAFNGPFPQETIIEYTEDQAIRWLLDLQHSRKEKPALPHRRARSSVPISVITKYELDTPLTGRITIGSETEARLSDESPTALALAKRQQSFLEPGRVLENLMLPPPADVAKTAAFREMRHDPLLERLQQELELKLLENPRIFLTQSLDDLGCDLVIDWPQRAKYGVQLKSNGDVVKAGVAEKISAQIQNSRRHGLLRLYVVLAADITGKSNAQKVGKIMSGISAMNDPYVVAVPPGRAWNLLFPSDDK